MSKTTQSLSLLQNQGIYGSFINKLMQYCPLFQGNHVRIVTSHILLLIAAYDFSLAGKVTQIIKGYGDIQLE